MRLFNALRTLPKQRKVEADCKLLHLCDLTPSLLSITILVIFHTFHIWAGI